MQPTASLVFTYNSCSKRTWEVKRESRSGVVLVQVEDNRPDCFGPSITREYSIQVSSDASAETKYVIMNPSMVTFADATN